MIACRNKVKGVSADIFIVKADFIGVFTLFNLLGRLIVLFLGDQTELVQRTCRNTVILIEHQHDLIVLLRPLTV